MGSTRAPGVTDDWRHALPGVLKNGGAVRGEPTGRSRERGIRGAGIKPPTFTVRRQTPKD